LLKIFRNAVNQPSIPSVTIANQTNTVGNMITKFVTAVLAGALTLGAGVLVAAESTAEQAVQPATIVVYRAEEATRTQNLKFQVQLDQRSLGRLQYDGMVVAEVAPGSYALGTSLSGTEALQIDLQPGQTYYIYSQLSALGDRVTPQLVVVEQQVAMEQQPALGSNI
jgi:hypothetical protein